MSNSTKVLYVSSAVQAVLMREVFIPEILNGFWQNFRPAGHGDVWRDVEIRVSEDGKLGPVGFTTMRNYNFMNLEFSVPNEARLVAVAQKVKPSSNMKSIAKEMAELGRIIAGRLVSRDAEPLKLYRGNHRPGTVAFSSAKARAAGKTLAEAAVIVPAAEMPVMPEKIKQPTAKKVITKTSNGATITRVPVNTTVVIPDNGGLNLLFANRSIEHSSESED